MKVNFLTKLFNKILGTEKADKELDFIKKKTEKQIKNINITLKKRGAFQRKIINKNTTTYFIAKAIGVLYE